MKKSFLNLIKTKMEDKLWIITETSCLDEHDHFFLSINSALYFIKNKCHDLSHNSLHLFSKDVKGNSWEKPSKIWVTWADNEYYPFYDYASAKEKYNEFKDYQERRIITVEN